MVSAQHYQGEERMWVTRDGCHRPVLLCGRLARPLSVKVFCLRSPDGPRLDEFLGGGVYAGRGGPWSPRGCPAFCAYLEPATATAEALAQVRGCGLKVRAWPRLLVTLEVRLPRVLDLTSPDVRRSLGLPADPLAAQPSRAVCCGRTLAQTIGQTARDFGLQGLLVPSLANPRGRSLVVFPDSGASSAARVRVLGRRLVMLRVGR
jgi:RES domain-containing protein